VQWRRPPVAQVRATFETMGFTLESQKFNYYNPTRHARFIAVHPREGAITLWSLAWADHWPGTVVEIGDHDPDS
jgi:hypothetical protein